MRQYRHPAYNYVYIVEIAKNEIKKMNFAACKEPRETLGSYYNRQTEKPDILMNAGFFGMINGVPVFNTIDEGVVRSNDPNYRIGVGITKEDDSNLVFGSLDDKSINWKDFLSAYPVLLKGNGPISNFTYATEINYNACRMCIAWNDSTIFCVHIGLPGMKFDVMSKMLYNLGATHAVNYDGGGSARMMVGGDVYGLPIENRSVDNVFAIYLKSPCIGSQENTKVVSDSAYTSYVVKAGDNWWKIAGTQLGDNRKYKELMAFNGISTTTLRVGQIIKIPVKEYIYTVKAGDSWWRIASLEMGSGSKYKQLAEYNNKKPTDTLYVGDKIRIPV